MRGCPWKVKVEEIIEFFDGFGKALTTDDIFIEAANGKRTGSALVFFEKEENAQDAKEAMNKKEIGTPPRWVELHDCNDDFFQKVCNLYD